MKKLKAFGYRVADLKPAQIQTMFQLFSEYYANVSFEQFRKDLLKKDHVFVLKDQQSLEIKGFSTIVALHSEVQGKPVRGFFSGDTVVDREYWGQGTLGVAFLKFLFLHKLRKPFQPLYWFLISKGYKTYLLMANNFQTHYPRFEKSTPPEIQSLIDTFSHTLYGEHYLQEQGVISFAGHQSHLKDALKQDITPITEELLQNPRVAFFQSKNPGWLAGDELACVALMTFSMPFYYQYKLLKKRFSRSKPRPERVVTGSLERTPEGVAQ
ncbi:hypothetical protein COW36_23395 [bacterium (Candidatus Blackallbacteria) CG17_big_fil_post_rev_8_21_14_2_50_48_46]|uniref:Uncharacterized protein n=1 Tax=bacterium (Candidatus Blackallbacteria) CG17_big_fil_post_rev_8_21_14_2_50_48_46 TaxID=2014261 RepID=A0A2M7FXK6_9BACT|nr:MAG: hypothetical protein COW64_17610 [bacterium (Candidatus Blackallbacteria) CG18_big_fil_WC_8_21_14_2_50_49_26]PIW13988.1 MAG: hypothetical protein COW36_23395 [bacterium (Candidatus Blackallbacteria) CG17_big_fil_post_rev_8_21_14_2_50_48_46]PIW46839.1 MAG: hypothetical protein COW20_14575 [bacterium (Candidatus Blackallbacteria) CG13_big_fil_rev_8_21_14_2_50_49_14]